MKTKIVYALISSPDDIYLEQFWVSIYSLRQFTPKAYVVVIADEQTALRIENKQSVCKLIDNIVRIDFPDGITNKEKSRWIKTNLREIVEGDFLFLDTDTVVTDDLADADSIHGDVAIALDLHCQLSKHPFHDGICKNVERLFGIQLRPDTNYYNSGVIYSKDTQPAHEFFLRWHENWKLAKDKPGGVLDQQSLVVTIDQVGCVNLLPGEYNCQILGSIAYLQKAKVVHFFNAQWSGTPLSPFFEKTFYKRLKNVDEFPDDMKVLALDCRSSFVSPSMIVGLDDMQLWLSPSFKMFRRFSKNRRVYRFMNWCSRQALKIIV